MTAPAPLRSPPGKRLIVAGSVLIGVSIIATVVTIGIGFRLLATSVDRLQRVDASGGTVDLEAKTYIIYAEYPGADEDDDPTPYQVEVSREGRTLAHERTVVERSYSWGNREGRSIAKVRVVEPGRYRIQAIGTPSPSGYAVGGEVASTGVLLAGGGFFLGFIVGTTGLVLLIVGLVKRSRSKRAFWVATVDPAPGSVGWTTVTTPPIPTPPPPPPSAGSALPPPPPAPPPTNEGPIS